MKSHLSTLRHCNAPDLEYSTSLLNGEVSVELPKMQMQDYSYQKQRRLDDKLPGKKVDDTVLQLTEDIDISKSLSEEMRKVVLVAIAHVKHAWYISKENWSEASEFVKI